MTKHEWKKDEKSIYLPKDTPTHIALKPMKHFVLSGKGNPNDAFFADYIEALYAASYGLRMSYKSGTEPTGFYEYTVYPLEGVWDLTDAGRQAHLEGVLKKEELMFKLMIRQPDFVTQEWAEKQLPLLAHKKKLNLINQIKLEVIDDGNCVQMLHRGSYDSEPDSFSKMNDFCEKNGLTKRDLTHREIYLSDARKVSSEKLQTVLRIFV